MPCYRNRINNILKNVHYLISYKSFWNAFVASIWNKKQTKNKTELDSMLDNTLNISPKCSFLHYMSAITLNTETIIHFIHFAVFYFECYISTVGSCYLLFIQYFTNHPACDNIRICRFILYTGCAGRLPDRDLLFAHVQTSAGLLFCFMTISAALP